MKEQPPQSDYKEYDKQPNVSRCSTWCLCVCVCVCCALYTWVWQMNNNCLPFKKGIFFRLLMIYTFRFCCVYYMHNKYRIYSHVLHITHLYFILNLSTFALNFFFFCKMFFLERYQKPNWHVFDVHNALYNHKHITFIVNGYLLIY